MSEKGEIIKVSAVRFERLLPGVEAATRGEPAKERGEFMHRNAALYGVDLDNLAR